MSNWRARLAVLALLALGAGMLIPAQASAFTSWYNCINKPSDTWCDGRANGTYDGQHSWDYNSASNPSGIPFYVCQRVYKPSSGNWLTGNSCGVDYIAHVYGNVTCICYDAEASQLSGSGRDIYGFADADY